MYQKIHFAKGFLLLSVVVFSFTQCTHIKKVYSSYKKDIVERNSPKPYFEKGLNNWVMKQYEQAEIDFNQAQEIDSTYAPAVSGLALITVINGSAKEALKLADQAQSMNSEDEYVFIAKALVLATINIGHNPTEEWLGKVEQEYNQAIALDDNNPESYFHRGCMYKQIFKLSKATADFEKILSIGTRYNSSAELQLSLIKNIQEADPETDIGKRIALLDEVTGEEIGKLFETETVIALISAPPKVPATTKDTGESLAEVPASDTAIATTQSTIRNLVNAPLDSKSPITRGEFAIIVEEVIIAITGDKYLANRYSGASRSRFLDVPSSHPAYSSICTSIEKKIMQLKMKGLFGPDIPISGPDVLLITKRLKNYSKM